MACQREGNDGREFRTGAPISTHPSHRNGNPEVCWQQETTRTRFRHRKTESRHRTLGTVGNVGGIKPPSLSLILISAGVVSFSGLPPWGPPFTPPWLWAFPFFSFGASVVSSSKWEPAWTNGILDTRNQKKKDTQKVPGNAWKSGEGGTRELTAIFPVFGE